MSGGPGLTACITTDASVYQPGQPIQIQFTETNNTSQPLKFIYGPSADGFDFSEGGAVVYKSNGGINPMVLVLDTLQPGESKTFNFTWNGISSNPFDGTAQTLAPGTFTVTNQLDPSVSATFQITSALSYSFTLDQQSYQVAQPIGISLTETNSSREPVTVNVNPTAFTVTNGLGQTLWQYQDSSAAPTTETLEPGQSLTQTATWDDIANVGASAGTNVWGTFNVTSPNAPAGLAPTGSVIDPLSFSLSAQAGSVAPGQPVVFNWVATNTDTVPITIPESAGELTVTNAATPAQVFSGSVAATAPTITLEPGQSWIQTITWPGSSTSSVPAGVYDAYFENGLQGDGTSVGIGVPSPVPFPISPLPISPGQPFTGIGTTVSTQQVGRHELFTLTLTNYENAPVTISGRAGVARFILKKNGKVIWRSTAKAKLATRAAQSLAPGAAIGSSTPPGPPRPERPAQARRRTSPLPVNSNRRRPHHNYNVSTLAGSRQVKIAARQKVSRHRDRLDRETDRCPRLIVTDTTYPANVRLRPPFQVARPCAISVVPATVFSRWVAAPF